LPPLPASGPASSMQPGGRLVLLRGRRADGDAVRVENLARARDARRVDVALVAIGAPVLPHDDELRAVEGDTRGQLIVGRRADRDAARVEDLARARDARRVDIELFALHAAARVGPNDQPLGSV